MIATNGVANQNRFYRPDHPNPSGNHSTRMITINSMHTLSCMFPLEHFFENCTLHLRPRYRYAAFVWSPFLSFFFFYFFSFHFFGILMTVHGRCSWRLCMSRGCNREQSVPRCSRIFFHRSVACYLRSEGDDEAHSFATFGKVKKFPLKDISAIWKEIRIF